MKAYKKALLKPWFDWYPDSLPLGAKFRGLWQKRTLKRIIKEIDERALDIQVAEKIFGRKVEVIEVTEYEDFGGDVDHPRLGYTVKHKEKEYVEHTLAEEYEWEEKIELPKYSTNIEDAMDILNELFPDDDSYAVTFQKEVNEGFAGIHCKIIDIEASGKNMSEAVCLAALKLKEIND